jgi:hypothetical protein
MIFRSEEDVDRTLDEFAKAGFPAQLDCTPKTLD